MRADATEFVARHRAGTRHRAARHHHAARGEGAEPESRAFGVAVTYRNPRRVDAQLVGCRLGERRFEDLTVRLDSDHQHNAAISQDARGAALEPRNERRGRRTQGRYAPSVRLSNNL